MEQDQRRAPHTEIDDSPALDRWLHPFDLKQAAFSARQDTFLRRLGVRVSEDAAAE